MLVWRGTLSKFGHFLILSTNHSHTSSKLSKSSQNWYSTKILFKYLTHNWCRNIRNFFRLLEQHEKSISSTAQSWMRLTLIGFFVQQNVHRMMHQRSLFCQPANLDEPVSLGDRHQPSLDPGIKDFGTDCDCGGECSELWSGKLGAKLDGIGPTKTDTIIQDHHHHHQDNHHHQPRLAGTCPVLCSSNGEYEEGACRCYPGWKGAECSIRHNECEVIAKDNLVWIVRFTFTFFLQSFRITLPTWKLQLSLFKLQQILKLCPFLFCNKSNTLTFGMPQTLKFLVCPHFS